MRVGVIGVGIMGGAMATNLLKAGHEVIGFDVDPSKVEALAGVGLVGAASPAAVADSSEVVVLSLPSVPALDEVAAALAAHPREGLICLETGTLPLDAKEKARSVLAGAGIELMDVPLSGTGYAERRRESRVQPDAFERPRLSSTIPRISGREVTP